MSLLDCLSSCLVLKYHVVLHSVSVYWPPSSVQILLTPRVCASLQLFCCPISSSYRYGNRGHNLPCIHTSSQRCFITTQNHGFAVDAENLPPDWSILFTNANDHSNEGIVHSSQPFFSVQFHPEHMGGPWDLEILFDVFLDTCQTHKDGQSGPSLQETLSTKLSTLSVPVSGTSRKTPPTVPTVKDKLEKVKYY